MLLHCFSGLPGMAVDKPLTSGWVPGPDAVASREEPMLFMTPPRGPPPPLLLPAHRRREGRAEQGDGSP